VLSEDYCPEPETALQQADSALYQAKQAGRNRVHILTPTPEVYLPSSSG